MANIPNVAIVATTQRISFAELEKAVKAVEYQIKNHVATFWDKRVYTALDSTIKAYANVNQVPFGSWLVSIDDQIDVDSYGYHYVTEKAESYAPVNTPYARLKYASNWSLILSHEVTEMLLNPYLTNFRYAEIGGRKVRLVVEPSDPAQFQEFGYKINDVLVSDFTTPNYYDLVWTPNTRYSYTGQITKPLELLENGYFSFEYADRLGVWWQMWKVKGELITKNITESAKENPKTATGLVLGFLLFIYLFSKRKS